MAYCIHCGTELVDNAKFCQKCGKPTGTTNEHSTRKQEFVGKIYKCPNCGEVLKAFEINCPACGHELRGTKASNAVKEFALKLEAIESRREAEKPRGLFAAADAQQIVSKTDEQKISLIKNFSIPNSKEDMLEFMILATSNINTDLYDSFKGTSIGKKELNDAWYSKVKQVYEKAKLSYSTDQTFTEIKNLHDKCKEEIKIQLDEGQYKYALMNADGLVYSGNLVNDEQSRQWEIKREYWIDRVITEAAENGIILERPKEDETVDNSEDENNTGGFVKGFQEGLQPGLDSFNQSIEEFNNIISGMKTDEGNKE